MRTSLLLLLPLCLAAESVDVPTVFADHGAVSGQAGTWSVVGSLGGVVMVDLGSVPGVPVGTGSTGGAVPVTVRPGPAVVLHRSAYVPPLFTDLGPLATREDEALEFAASAFNDSGEGLTFTFHAPSRGRIVDLGGGRARYVPDPDANGADAFTITVMSDGGEESQQTVQVIVTPVNDPPVCTRRPILTGLVSATSAVVGQTIGAEGGLWNDLADGPGAVATVLAWQRLGDGGWLDVQQGGATYLLTTADADHRLRLREVGTDGDLAAVTAYSDEIGIQRAVAPTPTPTPGGTGLPEAVLATIGLPLALPLGLATGVPALVADLPNGLAYDSLNQRIVGVPTGPPGTATSTILVGGVAHALVFTVRPGPDLTVANGLVPMRTYRLPDLTVGTPMRFQLPAVSLDDGYDASNLPAGIVLDPATGRLSGTPTVTGDFAVRFAIVTSQGVVVPTTLVFTVRPAPTSAPTITSIVVPDLTGGSGFSFRIPTQGAASVIIEGLPDGLVYDAATGIIRGTLPDLADPLAIPLRITVTGTDGQQTRTGLTLDVTPASLTAPRLGDLDPRRIAVGGSLTVPVPVVGDATTVVFTATGLPPGMTFDPATRAIQGTPTTTGIWQVVITARRVAITRGGIRTEDEVVARSTLVIQVDAGSAQTDAGSDGDGGTSWWVRTRDHATGQRSCGSGSALAIVLGGLLLAGRGRRRRG